MSKEVMRSVEFTMDQVLEALRHYYPSEVPKDKEEINAFTDSRWSGSRHEDIIRVSWPEIVKPDPMTPDMIRQQP